MSWRVGGSLSQRKRRTVLSKEFSQKENLKEMAFKKESLIL